MNERAAEIEQLHPDDNDDHQPQQDEMLAGLRALIGASLIASNARICSATMAAYLTRNFSRFQYSHEFSYINVNEFLKKSIEDYSMDSSADGIPFITSRVANYLYRPRSMEQVCLYDSLTFYSLRRKSKTDSKATTWIQQHPSKNHLKLMKLKDDKVKIPVINYYDFIDTKSYNGKQIDMDDLSECNKIELHAMEMNARISSVLFIPFRCISELKDTNNMFLNGFR